MADYQDDVQQIDSGPGQAQSQETIQDWAAAAQAFLQRHGRPPGHRDQVVSPTTGRTYAGMPAGYHVADGRVQRMGWFDEWGRGAAIGMGLGTAGAFGAQALNGLMTPAAGSATGGTGAASQALGMQGLASGAGADAASIGGGIGAGSLASGAAGAAGGFPWERVLGAGLAGVGMIGAATNQPDAPDMSPELRAMYDAQRRRFESQNPLYESVAQLAFNRLPTSATAGLDAPSLASAAAAIPQSPTGEFSESQEMRDMLRQQQIRGRMGDPIFDAITRLANSRMPGGR